jgi:hypothetical protein
MLSQPTISHQSKPIIIKNYTITSLRNRFLIIVFSFVIIKCGAGQSRAVKVIGHIQRLCRRGQTASIDWIKGHSDNKGNDRAEYLAGQAAESQGPSGQHRVSIAWMREKISNSYTMTANIELQSRGNLTIIPLPPKKSALDKARNREAGIASQLRTNHGLSGVYLKRIGKRDSAGC